MVNFFVTKKISNTSKAAKWVSIFAVFVFAVSSLQLPTVFAQTTGNAQLGLAQSERAALEDQLAQLEAEIAQKQQELKGQQGQSQTLSNDIAVLKTKINKAKLDIKAKNIVITQLGGEITDKSNEIQSLSDKIDNEKESLAQLIRNTNNMDQSTIIDLMLTQNSISSFYNDVAAYDSIKSGIKQSVDQILGLKSQTETAKQLLEKKQGQEIDAKAAIVQTQIQIEQDQKQQNQLLSISKNKEKEYQAVLADRAAKVSQIKARLFTLAGGGAAIPFGTALAYAQKAQSVLNIDPAYLLAELTQESNLGANVGKCYLTQTDTTGPTAGYGFNISSGKVWPNLMKPSRDVQPFLDITASLGLDPLKTVVSCPIASAGGYGGAMGPAQFIPSTWKLFQSRLRTDLGGDTPNPWNPQHAFMAASMYLTDLGAVGGSTASQLRASCKYYGSGGSTCSYGRNVQTLKNSIQSDIDYLEQYGVSRR